MYRLPEKKLWKGRIDKLDGSEGARWHQKIQFANLAERNIFKLQEGQLGFAVLGFRSDEGVRRNQGRVGAIEGPRYVRKTLSNLPYHFEKNEVLVDAGDVFCLGKFLEFAQVDLGDNVDYLIEKGYKVIGIGGGHEMAYGTYLGIHKFRKRFNKKVGIINFDAHFDMRDYYETGSSGTPFLQIAHLCQKDNLPFSYLPIGIQKQSNTRKLFQTAEKFGVEPILSEKVNFHYLGHLEERIDNFIDNQDVIYLSLCLDVFSGAYAPGVSALNGMGVSPDIIFHLIGRIAKSGKVVCFDIAEYNPKHDVDSLTAKLVSSLVFQFVDSH